MQAEKGDKVWQSSAMQAGRGRKALTEKRGDAGGTMKRGR